MTEETHDHHHEGSLHTYIHRARRTVVPLAAAMAVLAAFHSEGWVFSAGAVVSGLLFLCAVAATGMHDWRVCPQCSRAPRRFATPEARKRQAERYHNLWDKRFTGVLLVLLLAHALLPKPYMTTWWSKTVAALCYLAVALLFARITIRMDHHKLYRDECHVEWCRAGLSRKPGVTRRQQRQMWTGHHGVWVTLPLALVACAVGLYSMHHGQFSVRLVYGFLLGLLVRVMMDIGVHANEPCMYCARNLPTNGGEAAEKRMTWLKLFHRTRVVVLTLAFLVLIASWVMAGTVAAKTLVPAGAALLVYWAVLERVHSPVKPWCPWCKDDGGEDADAGVPDPSTNVPTPA